MEENKSLLGKSDIERSIEMAKWLDELKKETNFENAMRIISSIYSVGFTDGMEAIDKYGWDK